MLTLSTLIAYGTMPLNMGWEPRVAIGLYVVSFVLDYLWYLTLKNLKD